MSVERLGLIVWNARVAGARLGRVGRNGLWVAVLLGGERSRVG
jgi:hypothetical protein